MLRNVWCKSRFGGERSSSTRPCGLLNISQQKSCRKGGILVWKKDSVSYRKWIWLAEFQCASILTSTSHINDGHLPVGHEPGHDWWLHGLPGLPVSWWYFFICMYFLLLRKALWPMQLSVWLLIIVLTQLWVPDRYWAHIFRRFTFNYYRLLKS